MRELNHGVELFNAGAYFEAHEEFEAAWIRAPLREQFFLQALIHFAAGLHHCGRGNAAGAVRQLEKALRKIAGYLPEHCGIDTARLWHDGQRWRESANGRRRIDLATIALKR